MIDTFIRKPLSMFIRTWYMNLHFQLYVFIISNYRSYISDIKLGPKLKCTLSGKFTTISKISCDKENEKYQ